MKTISKTLTIILYLLLIALILSMIFIYYFEHKLGRDLINCGENQVRYITNIVINNSIRKYLQKENNIDFLIKEVNDKNEITLVRYNTKEMNKVTTELTELIEKDIQSMMKGNFNDINLNVDKITEDYYEKIKDGMIFTVSLGTATGSSILANLGPKIPLKLKLASDVTTQIESNIKEYGLNNAMVEIDAKINVSLIIQMPFLSKRININNKIPITMEIIQGNLPEYYMPTQSKTP